MGIAKVWGLTALAGIALAACGKVRNHGTTSIPEPRVDAGDASSPPPPPSHEEAGVPERDASIVPRADSGIPTVDAASRPDAKPAPVDAAPSSPEASVDAGCVPPCYPISRSRSRPNRGCFPPDAEEVLGCNCDPTATALYCQINLIDGSMAFMTTLSAVEPASEWRPCTDEERDGPAVPCEFEHCKRRPLDCSFATSCPSGSCDSLELESDGCQRPVCLSDAECPSNERCVWTGSAYDGWCLPLMGQCYCRDAGTYEPNAGVCNSVEKYGPRGAWTELVIDRTFATCPSGECRTTYTVTPSGQLTIARGSTTNVVRLSEGTMLVFARTIDGPTVRARLRDGGCAPPPPDVVIRMELRTAQGALSSEVTSCALAPGTERDDVYALYNLVNLL